MNRRCSVRFSSPNSRLSRRRPALALLGGAAALLISLSGCATTGGDATASSFQAATATSPASANVEYGWHDPKFYQPWFDPTSIVLPPPPFTGFSSDGKIAPMLPTRPRPADAPAPGGGVPTRP